MTRRVVVIGYGMAGARLAEDIRRLDPDGAAVELTIVGAEPRPAYNRVLLSTVLAGHLPVDAVELHSPEWATKHGVRVRLGTTAVALDRAVRRVLLADGDSVGYDDVVLATGAAAWLPPVTGLTGDDGAPAPGVSALRTLADCERILAAARPDTPVAVLGGGLLGVETARGLTGRGCRVTVVHPTPRLLPGRLDPDAAYVLRRALEDHGIEFRLGAPAAGYAPGDGLKLVDGTPVPAGLVVVSAGVRP
ncbi:MAG TPA: FAD-dependent oxidoreductase, partial [Pseudonocardiaceae bacterium]|nr:FAD-dependent oxidoreductase [Pseudonocardiaceae bacterium]